MPTPKPNESKDDFLSRCIPQVLDEGTAENGEQATAICSNMYNDSKKSKKSLEDKLFRKFQKISYEQQIVEVVVYEPNTLDTWGELMLKKDIEKMAHEFMKKGTPSAVDTQHNEIPNGSHIVESFVAKEGDPYYNDGAWVVKIHIPNKLIWKDVKTGKINGVSMQGMAKMLPVVGEIEMDAIDIGETEEADDHTHLFFLKFDEDGRVIEGRTSTDENHSHVIRMGTATESSNGHSHRYFA